MGHCTSKDQKDQKRLNRRIEDQIKKVSNPPIYAVFYSLMSISHPANIANPCQSCV